MALSKTITSSTGLEVQNAYIHIDEYSCNKEDGINARIRAYVSRDLMKGGSAFISGSENIVTLQGDYSNTAVNTKKQIYTCLKTLDEYKDTSDVLED